jgi:hypothetical protein
MHISRNTLVLIICSVIVLGGAFYYFFLFNTDIGSALTTDGTPASQVEVSFIALIGKIDPITFDTTIFSDPRFTELKDIRTTIIPEAVGRKDPFASVFGLPQAP